MINKKIWEDSPSNADVYRKDYVNGIQKYIERKNTESKLKRQSFMPPEKLAENRDFYRKLYRDMLGVDKVLEEKGSVCEKIYVGEDDMCSIYRLKLYITKEIPFYAMFLIPHREGPVPLVIAQHGGGGTPELCCNFVGKNNYNNMVQRLLKRGVAVIAPQLLLWSLEEKETMRKHDIPYDRGAIDNSLKRFGISMTALEISGIMRCIDYACTMPIINSDSIGMIGLSYGGYFTLHTMAADERIKAGYAAGFFNDRDVYDWSDWCYKGSALTFQDAEVAALCAPRKLYISVGKQDPVFDYKSACAEAERVRDFYISCGCENNYCFSLWEGGHTIEDSDRGYDFIFEALNCKYKI